MRDSGVRASLDRVVRAVETLLLPPICAGCGRRGAWFCESCEAAVTRVEVPRCARCDAPTAVPVRSCRGCAWWPAALRAVRAPYLYEGPVRSAVHRVKYRGEHARARDLGQRLAAFAAVSLADWAERASLVAPIPLHRSRRRQRGFNQSEVLGRAVADVFGLPLETGLVRVRATPRQVGLGRSERLNNVRGAFSWSGPRLDDRFVIVVDDVVTTGATLAEAAQALTMAGAAGVLGLALAREP